MQFQPDDSGVAVAAVAGVELGACRAGRQAVAQHALVDKRNGARKIQRWALQLDLVVVQQDRCQVLHCVLARNVDLVVHIAKRIAQPRHLRQRRDDHVLGRHRHLGGEIRNLFAGDQGGRQLRLAEHAVHAHQRVGKARHRAYWPHRWPVGSAGIGLVAGVLARIGRRCTPAEQCCARQTQQAGPPPAVRHNGLKTVKFHHVIFS